MLYWHEELQRGAAWLHNFNNNSNFNANERNVNNNNRLRGIAHSAETYLPANRPRDLWQELCSYQNLELAFKNARRHKTLRPYVIEFEKNLKANLLQLRADLLFHAYRPKPLETFVIQDPKTRKISKSAFQDRIVHHALCNIIEPMFEKAFIHDSYANRIGKGTLKAIQWYEQFQRKLSRNNRRRVFVLKADIRHYFDEVDHTILLSIIEKRISDPKVLWLIKSILDNYHTSTGKGMPLGNLTSQFFANVYLNELDQFIKHGLRAKYYIRYVDDFIILHGSEDILQQWKAAIGDFLTNHLLLVLHPEKTRISVAHRGIDFLGFKIFSHHRLVRRRNRRRFERRVDKLFLQYDQKEIDYDAVYNIIEGWCAYAKHANTYERRKALMLRFEQRFHKEVSSKEVNRYLKSIPVSPASAHPYTT